MKNLLVKLIFVVTILISFQVIMVEDSKAACAESAPGVISQVAVLASCQDEPTSYGIVIFKIYMCTAAPVAPTVVAPIDLSNCVETFSNTAGHSASLSTGVNTILSGTATRPANGTYTHGVVFMDNTFAITAKKQFQIAQIGQVAGVGVHCATANGAGTVTNLVDTNDTTNCGNDANLAVGTYTETLASFDNPVFTATATELNVAGTGANITAHLVDADQNLAANSADVDKLYGIVEFADAVTITNSTSDIQISFNVSEGMNIDDGAGSMRFGSGPFQATITVTP
jgi:hypothetical protein